MYEGHVRFAFHRHCCQCMRFDPPLPPKRNIIGMEIFKIVSLHLCVVVPIYIFMSNTSYAITCIFRPTHDAPRTLRAVVGWNEYIFKSSIPLSRFNLFGVNNIRVTFPVMSVKCFLHLSRNVLRPCQCPLCN